MRSTKIPYMTYYVFHMNFGHDKHDSEDTSHQKLKVKVMRSTKIPYMTYYVFHINFGHDKHDSEDTSHQKLN